MNPESSSELHWAPLSRQRLGVIQSLGIVARHLVSLVGVLLFDWSAGQFILLSVFNVAFSITCIGVVGVGVSMRKEAGTSSRWTDEIGTWAMLLVAGVIISLVLTLLFGWMIAVFTVSSGNVLFDATLGESALAIIIAAAPGLLQQYQADLRSSLSEDERKRRDRPNVIVLVLCASLIFVASGFIGQFGQYGLIVLVMAVTSLFIFRDLRPDLMRELTRPKNLPR